MPVAAVDAVQYPFRALDFFQLLRKRQRIEDRVRVRVVAQGVAFSGDPPRQRGMLFGFAADQEEAGTHVVPGDRVEEVLSYVEFFSTELEARLRRKIEQAISQDRIGLEESARVLRRFKAGLAGYTYLTRDAEAPQ